MSQSTLLSYRELKPPQNTSAVLCTLIIQPHTFSSPRPILHPPCALSKPVNPKLLLGEVPSIVVFVRTGSDPTRLLVPVQRVSAVIFSHISGRFGADRYFENFPSWRLHLQQMGRPLPATQNTRQLHPEVFPSSSGWLSQQLLVKLHHLKAMKPERKERRESRKPLPIAFISSSPFLPVAIVLSVPGN